MYITAIYGSPRKSGNTDLLLQACIRGMQDAGQAPHELYLRNLQFSPCIECGGCSKSGRCVIADGMDEVYQHLLKSDCVVVSAPVFFYGLNALTKAMVDRLQCFWVKKYLLHLPVRDPGTAEGCGILLSAGGSRGAKNFDGILLTMKYFYDALDMPFSRSLVYHNIDAQGSILKHPTALTDAYTLGKTIAENKT